MGPFFGPKNGTAKMQNLEPQHVFGIEDWGEALVPALVLLNFPIQRWLLCRMQSWTKPGVCLLEFPRNGFQASRRKFRLYIYFTHTTTPTLGDLHAIVQREETGKIHLHSTRISLSLVLVIAAHTHFCLLKT